ncbi:MAG TPA: hypothetical protein VEZ24_12710 [Microvirga sp.]|nr:hypothetical protein [Microvirga sp.]
MDKVDTRSVLGQKVDADESDVMNGPAFFLRVPLNLEAQLMPGISLHSIEIECDPGPAIMI